MSRWVTFCGCGTRDGGRERTSPFIVSSRMLHREWLEQHIPECIQNEGTDFSKIFKPSGQTDACSHRFFLVVWGPRVPEASPQKSNMIHTAGTSTVSGSDQVDAGGVPSDEVAVMHHMHTIRCMRWSSEGGCGSRSGYSRCGQTPPFQLQQQCHRQELSCHSFIYRASFSVRYSCGFVGSKRGQNRPSPRLSLLLRVQHL